MRDYHRKLQEPALPLAANFGRDDPPLATIATNSYTDPFVVTRSLGAATLDNPAANGPVMNGERPQDRVGILASGGLDSCILIAHMLRQGVAVQPLYVRSEFAWQPFEERALRRFLDAIDVPRLSPLVVFDLPLSDVYGEHWSMTGRDVPGEMTPDEAVFLPGRNALLVLKPGLWCQIQGIGRLALALLAQSPFADATEPFFAVLQETLNRSGQRPLRLEVPFCELSKAEVMRLGAGVPLQFTFSCLAPRAGLHCGECNKCAERRRAFRNADFGDLTLYARAKQTASK